MASRAAAGYDADAATYGDEEHPWDMQRAWVAPELGLIPPSGMVLDAPCGTGKYFPMLAAAGVRVVGVDQSAGMLARVRARRATDPTKRRGRLPARVPGAQR